MSRSLSTVPRNAGHGIRLSLLLVAAMLLRLDVPAGAAAAPLPPQVPDVPLRVHAQAEPASAAVSWMVPADGGSGITGYIVETDIGSTAIATDLVHTTACDLSADTPTCLVHIEKLDPGRTYSFVVRALNDDGESRPSLRSNAVSWQPGISVPSQPLEPKAAASGPASATVTWLPPKTGGSPITGYEITAYVGDSGSVAGWAAAKAGDASAVVTGLEVGKTYRFAVQAVNLMGWSAESNHSAPVTPQISVPSAPVGVGAASGPDGITVSWAAPDNGGSMILNYTVTAYIGSTGRIAARVVALSAGSIQMTYPQLACGVAYTFTVAARNALGLGPESSRSNPAVITASVPAAPSNVRATLDGGRASITWTAPSDGGSPITGYTVVAYRDYSNEVVVTREVLGNATQVTLIGVDRALFGPGSYTFAVSAQNAIGSGPQSPRSNPVTRVSVPSAPLNVRATTSPGTPLVTWDAPASDGGAPLTAYIVSAYRSGYGLDARQTVAPGLRGTTFTGLATGAMYTFIVAAVNGAGQGPDSQPSNPITLATRPSAPRNLSVTPGASSAVLSWDPPASDGGRPVTQYDVTVTDGTQTILSRTLSATTTQLTGLSASTLYTASVVAENSVGQSDAQSTSFRPLNLPPTLTLPDTQTVPYGHTLSFDVSASDPDPADHPTLAAAGLPAGLAFTDRGDGTGSISGSVGAQAGTYLVTISASDGHNPAVTGMMRIVVLQDDATVTLSPANPATVKLNAKATASGAVTLRSTVSSADGAGDISNATPVTYVLTGLSRGVTYTRAAVLAPGHTAGSVEATVRLKGLPVDAYRIQVSVGGWYFKGASAGLLTVYRVQARAVQARGAIAREGKPGSLTLNARYLAGGRLSGQLGYSQQVESGTISLKSTSLAAMIVSGSRSYIQGSGTTNDGARVRFLLTVVRGGTGRAALGVIDASGQEVQGLSFDLQPFTSSHISFS
jgi:fibronectin type III domain protein